MHGIKQLWFKGVLMLHKVVVKSDLLGTFASGLCMLHCFATPLLFMIQPISVQAETAPLWWKSLDYIFLFVSFFAVYWSSNNSSKKGIKYLLWVSWMLLTVAIINEKMELFHWGEWVVYIPALSLLFTHLYNRKYCRCDDATCCANE